LIATGPWYFIIAAMGSTRRDFLTTAVSIAGAATTQNLTHAKEQEHDHQVVPSDLTLRVKSLESLLVESELVTRAEVESGKPARGSKKASPALTVDKVPTLVAKGVPACPRSQHQSCRPHPDASPMPPSSAKSHSMCTQCVLRHENYGASKRAPTMRFT
jgi:hypothetical protein